jgi:hypothetical protein
VTCYTDPFTPNRKPVESSNLIGRFFGGRDATRKDSEMLSVA